MIFREIDYVNDVFTSIHGICCTHFMHNCTHIHTAGDELKKTQWLLVLAKKLISCL